MLFKTKFWTHGLSHKTCPKFQVIGKQLDFFFSGRGRGDICLYIYIYIKKCLPLLITPPCPFNTSPHWASTEPLNKEEKNQIQKSTQVKCIRSCKAEMVGISVEAAVVAMDIITLLWNCEMGRRNLRKAQLVPKTNKPCLFLLLYFLFSNMTVL